MVLKPGAQTDDEEDSLTNYILLVIAKTEQLFEDMNFIGQMANVTFTSSLGDYVFFWNYHYYKNILIVVKNPTKGDRSTFDYLSQLDKKTLKKIIKMYEPDFEMFQYSPDGYYWTIPIFLRNKV